MIQYHNCPHCSREMKMWLPIEINNLPIVYHEECGNYVNFQFVYDRREHIPEELKELEQLRYLKEKYELNKEPSKVVITGRGFNGKRAMVSDGSVDDMVDRYKKITDEAIKKIGRSIGF